MARFHAFDVSGPQATGMGVVTFDNLTADMAALRAAGSGAGIVDAGTTKIGDTDGGRAILALKIGKNPSNRVLLVGCHHAREWISVEIPFLVGKYLVDNYKAGAAAKTVKEKRVQYLVDNAEIWVVPMLNPDGHKKSLTDVGWRTNRRKVVFAAATNIERWLETAPFKTSPLAAGKTAKHYRIDPKKAGKKVIEIIPAGTYEGVDLNRNYPVPAGPKGSTVPAWGVETSMAFVVMAGLLRLNVMVCDGRD